MFWLQAGARGMIILGLTGSIGMGKTTAANAFRSLSFCVHDADLAVHKLMVPGGAAVDEVLNVFPSVAMDGYIDRQALGVIVFADDSKLQQLEGILHPLVRMKEHAFLAAAARRRERLVVLDIPLLLETGGDARCDGVVVVSAPVAIQKSRVLRRPGMTDERLQAIMGHQINDVDKCHMADFVVQTGLGRAHSLRAIANIVTVTKSWSPRHWPPVHNSREMA
jgi:dephospho-CoA kinase